MLHTETYRDAVIDGHSGATIIINGGYFSAKGGADIFRFNNGTMTKYSEDSVGRRGHVSVRQASFSIQKVDYIRGLDSSATNDTEVSVAIGRDCSIFFSFIISPENIVCKESFIFPRIYKFG